MRQLRYRRLWLLLWLGAVLAVIVLSLVKPPALAMQAPDGSDKLLHFLAYFLLALGAVQLFWHRAWLWGCAAGLIGLGLGLELAQGFWLPQIRSLDARDVLANTLGVLAGMMLAPTPAARLLLAFEQRVPGLRGR